MSTEWQPGQKIRDRWEIHKILRGGMGIVYLVYDHELHAAFAAKTFQDQFLVHSPQRAAQFRQECISWIGLGIHPNTVHAIFVETVEDKPFLFLEYVTGGDLSRWIGSPRLLKDLPQVLRMGIQFCDGMIHANAQGIKVHRDIKPQNCLITGTGMLKVTDFGLAKTFDDYQQDFQPGPNPSLGKGLRGLFRRTFGPRSEEHTPAQPSPNVAAFALNLTKSGVAAGTPLYMAPEQFADVKHVDARADIYSFGVMLFQMITGRLPFSGKNWDDLERSHKTENVPDAGIRLAGLSDLISACLAKDPGGRLPNFTAVRGRLAAILESLTGEKPAPAPFSEELNMVQEVYKGVSLSELGKYQQAIVCFDKFLSVSPKTVEAWACKGEALAKMGKNSDALACFDHALGLEPKRARLWETKGSLLAKIGKADEAFDCFDHAIELDSALDLAWNSKGLLLDRLGRYEEALLCHERTLQIDGNSASWWHNKGLVLEKLKRHQESIVCNDRALQLYPQYAQAWFIKGAALLNGFRKTQEAAVCFEKAAALGYGPAASALEQLRVPAKPVENASLPMTPHGQDSATTVAGPRPPETAGNQASPASGPGVDPAQALFDQGKALVEKGDHYRGLDCLEEARRLGHPLAARALADTRLILKVVGLAQAGQRDQARACLEEAQRLDHPPASQLVAQLVQTIDQVPAGKIMAPRDKHGWNDMGGTLVEAGKLWEAVTCFKRAIDLDPQYEIAWLNLGLALAKFKEFQQALIVFDRLLSIKPRSAQAWDLKGMTLANLQKHVEALASYNRALDLDPRLVRAWCNKSSALNELKRHEEAIECCNRALELEPLNFAPLSAKAKILLSMGRKKEALGCAEQMRLIDPDKAKQFFGF